MKNTESSAPAAPAGARPDSNAGAGWLSLAHPVTWRITLTVMLAACILPIFFAQLNHDVGCTLNYVTRLLDGAKLYVDVVDVNPPLFIYLFVPPVAAARLLNVAVQDCLNVYLALLAVLSLGVTAGVLRWMRLLPDRAGRRAFLLIVLVLFLVVAGYELGQREYLMLLFVTPYLLATAGRAMDRPLHWGPALAVGLMAGVGIALKPYFVLVYMAMEVYLTFAARRGWFWRRPEGLAIVGFHVLYILAVAGLTPQYFAVAARHSQLYWAYDNGWPFLLDQLLVCAPAAYLSVVAFAAVRPSAETTHLRRILLLATVVLVAIALGQHKGFTYHYLPCMGTGILLLAAIFASLFEQPDAVRRLLRPGTTALGCVLVLFLAWYAGKGVSRAYDRALFLRRPTLATVLRPLVEHKPVVMLSTSVYPAFPLINEMNAWYGGRLACLGHIGAFYNDPRPKADGTIYRTRAEMSELERSLYDETISDFITYRPALVIVDKSVNKQGLPFGSPFDFLEYFNRDERFRAAWADIKYKYIGQFDTGDHGPFRMYLQAALVPPGMALPPEPR